MLAIYKFMKEVGIYHKAFVLDNIDEEFFYRYELIKDLRASFDKEIKRADWNTLCMLIPADAKEAYRLPWSIRDCYIPFMGYQLLNYDYLDKLAKFFEGKRVLEVMSGNGVLARLLRDRGVDIIATDIAPGEANKYPLKRTFTDIEAIDAVAAVEKYGAEVDYILMGWPPYENTIDFEVAKAIERVCPETLIFYIGEAFGGCTSSDAFFEKTKEVEVEGIATVTEAYAAWRSIYDWPRLLKVQKD